MAAAKDARKRHRPHRGKAAEATAKPAKKRRPASASPPDQPMAAGDDVDVEVDGRQLKLSNLDKVLYPEVGFTKGEVIDYYARIAPVMLAHLGDRGVTLRRYPERRRRRRRSSRSAARRTGPTWVPVRSARRPRRRHRLLPARLPAGAGVGRRTWPPSSSTRPMARATTSRRRRWSCSTSTRARRPASPSAAEVALCRSATCSTASASRCWPKTSGSKGLQLYLPLNRPGLTHEQRRGVRPRPSPRCWSSHHADRVTSTMRKDVRAGQGVHRLEPEQPAQDDRLRRTRCGPGPGRRCRRPVDLGRGRGRRRRRRPARVRGRRRARAGRRARRPVRARCSRSPSRFLA